MSVALCVVFFPFAAALGVLIGGCAGMIVFDGLFASADAADDWFFA